MATARAMANVAAAAATTAARAVTTVSETDLKGFSCRQCKFVEAP